MTSLSSSQILDLWERGSRRHSLDRALLLYNAAEPTALEQLAKAPIGRRDQALLRLHGVTFGALLSGYVDCPECGTRVEFSIHTDELRIDPSDEAIEARGIAVRRPTSRDLAEVAQEPDPGRAAYRLAQRCCADADGTLPELSADEFAAVEEALAEADPAGDIVLDLTCAQCGSVCQPTFDPAGFLWQEIEGRARALMSDVHALAQAYGWTESEVLALGDARRAAYIEMVLA
jgi:hypothetical protein